MIGYIYKLQKKDGTGEFYIGSTSNIERRKELYLEDLQDEKKKDRKSYSYILANGGFNNFNMIFIDNIELKDDYSDIKKLRQLEQFYMDKLHPTLNSKRANGKCYKIRKCVCGGSFHLYKRQKHFRSEKHKLFKTKLKLNPLVKE
tara:strand:+ start:150 stop:584 length:435 start_codon:yes stop_codon:yes gene_type:complete